MIARPSGLAGGDRLDRVAVGQRPGQVAELAVDPRRDHRGAGGRRLPGTGVKQIEGLARGSARCHLVLASGEGDVQRWLGRHGGSLVVGCRAGALTS